MFGPMRKSQFEHKFQTEEGVDPNQCWCQKTRVITISCGITVSKYLQCIVWICHKASV